MATNQTHQRVSELRRIAEEAIALAPEEFQKMPVADSQGLIRNLLLEGLQLETQFEQLRKTEQQLDKARKQADELFNLAPVGYFILDDRGIISSVNFTACHMLDIAREEMLNAPFIRFVEPQYRDELRAYFKEIARTGHLASIEINMTRGDSGTFYAQLQTVVLYEESNITYRVSLADITERKKAQEALQAAEKRCRSYLDVTGELGWTTNAEGEVVEDIPTWQRYTGQTFEEVKGWGWTSTLHPDDLERTRQAWQKAVRERTRYETEYRLRRHDGVYRDFLARGVPVFAEDGHIIEWVGISFDITERKIVEMALQESEQRYRDLAESFPESLFETDVHGRVIYGNRKALVSFNLTPDDLKKGINIFDYLAPGQKHIAMERFSRVLEQADIGADEYTLLRQDGSRLQALVHSVRIMKNGKPVGIRGVIIDLTDLTGRKHAAQLDASAIGLGG